MAADSAMAATGPPAATFAARLCRWHALAGRHDLPWQRPATPYRVWVSEVMLQQTQVATVIPYFQRFMARFPDIPALAQAPVTEVLALWSGLGYYARARNLHRTAVALWAAGASTLPGDADALVRLPGIGRSTAGAILALGFGIRAPILDGNVRRVLARHQAIAGWPGEPRVAALLWAASDALTPATQVGTYTQAIMDLGATLCTRAAPACMLCPVAQDCQARLQGAVAGFPAPRPARNRAQRRLVLLLLQNDAREVLLEQRPPAGIWGGLWSLPEYDGTPAGVAEHCRSRYGLHVHTVRPLAARRHTLTHLDLELEPWLCAVQGAAGVMDGAAQLWYNPASATPVGLPAPVRRLLAVPPGAAAPR